MITSIQLITVFLLTSYSCPLRPNSPCHCGIRNDSTTYIQCSRKNLLEIPSFMRSFSYDQIVLDNNFISSIHEDSFNNLRVRQLWLTGNPISNVSSNAFASHEMISHLEEIYIDFLKTIKRIPHNLLCKAAKLKVLDVKGLDLGPSPSVVFCKNQTKLKRLSLSSCNIKQSISIKHLNSLDSLDLSQNMISNPINLPLVKVLNLSFNLISNIQLSPTTINVDLSNNQLSSLPSLCKLTNPIHVNLASNKFTELPECQRLVIQYLNMRSNRIKTVQKVNFERIVKLDLSNNHLEKFDGLGAGIEELILSNNKLDRIPQNLPITLTSLDLRNNDICSISSASVRMLVRLHNYNLQQNPFYCDCNLRSLQQDVKRRNFDLVCSGPRSLKGLKVRDVDLKCDNSEAPICVKLAHGPHLLQSNENTASITEMYVRYVPSKTILVVWSWFDSSEDITFRVSFEPHGQSATHISSELDSTVRRFALQNAIANHVYTVCVIALSDGSAKHKRCTDIYTNNGDVIREPIKLPMVNSNILLILIGIIVVITFALTIVLILLIVVITKRRQELKRWQIISQAHHLSSLESGYSGLPFIDQLYKQPTTIASRGFCCCCGKSQQHLRSIDTEQSGLNTIHMYQEIHSPNSVQNNKNSVTNNVQNM